MGGRTEAFKSYCKCIQHQQIFYLDVCSLYPAVNALDDYAVGYKKYVDITRTLVQDILNDKFIGIVKCDIRPRLRSLGFEIKWNQMTSPAKCQGYPLGFH